MVARGYCDDLNVVDEFFHVETKVCGSLVGIDIARDGPDSNSDSVLLARLVVFREFRRFLRGSRELLPVPSLHRPSTDGLKISCILSSISPSSEPVLGCEKREMSD